jgi:crotonobetainyl-CoA:carnitine CoA-transferase CaiB-like acyl-CoA transferase
MSGIRVLEVASWVYVPMAGGVLAEWGADVVKIEHPEGGDPQRGLISSGLMPGGGAVNFAVEHPNRNKRSVAIDIGTEEGRDVLLKLAETSDVFLTSFLPAARRKLRIDVDDIRAVNPSIIYVRGSGNGQRGPEAERGGYDGCTYWARGGSMDIATPGGVEYPVGQPGGAYGDTLGGGTIAGGISAALFHRERTGEALTVDCSLLGMGAWATAFSIAMCSAFGIDQFPKGARNQMSNPLVSCYKTSDGRFLMLVMLQSDRYWPELMTKVGRPELVDDPRFVDATARAQNRVECIAILDEIFAGRTFVEWKALLNDVEGVWSPVQTPREVWEDPQVIANGIVQDVTVGDGSLKLVAAPLQFNETPSVLTRAPDHGEHTDDVLLELGFDMDQILDLKIKGAIL